MSKIYHRDFDFGPSSSASDYLPEWHIGMELPEAEPIEKARIVITNRVSNETTEYKLMKARP